MRSKISVGSIITGLGLGSLISLFIVGFLPDTLMRYSILFYFILIPSFGILGYNKPKFTEYLAYALSLFFILQYLWDYRVLDRSFDRNSIFYNALILLIINLFTGSVRITGAKSTLRRALGLK